MRVQVWGHPTYVARGQCVDSAIALDKVQMAWRANSVYHAFALKNSVSTFGRESVATENYLSSGLLTRYTPRSVCRAGR